GDGQFRALEIDRIRPREDGECTRLDYLLHVGIPQRQIVGRKLKGDRPPLARPKRDSLEALELDHGPSHGCLVVVDVQLDHLVSWPRYQPSSNAGAFSAR